MTTRRNSFENVSGFHGSPVRDWEDEPPITKWAVQVQLQLRLSRVPRAQDLNRARGQRYVAPALLGLRRLETHGAILAGADHLE
ncbi:MAG: hypothetical protein WA215_07925 [Candidatus Cybelea sp.]